MKKENFFDIVLSQNKTKYYPGDYVTGQCILYLKKDMHKRILKISMHGVATVYWTETRSRSDGGTDSVSYSDEVAYFSMRRVLFGQNATNENNTLAKGQHEFNFNFSLPLQDIPMSLKEIGRASCRERV